MHYSIMINDSPIGPMTMEQVMCYNVNENTQVSKDGSPWAPLYTYPELMTYYRGHGGSYINADDEAISSKKTLCGIFALIFGAFGIQYFILGKIGGGLLCILLTLLTCGLWELVTFVQGILMLTMSNGEFRRKYMDSTSLMPMF